MVANVALYYSYLFPYCQLTVLIRTVWVYINVQIHSA